jgi:galactose-1-phosphate uridylyltransferase
MNDYFILSRIENGIFIYHNVYCNNEATTNELDTPKDTLDTPKDTLDTPKDTLDTPTNKTENDKGITYFLYHVLKNNNIIDSEDVNVLIYEHNIVKNTCDLIILQDKNKSELEEFDKENLETIFYDIIKNIESINANSNNMLSVSYSNNNYNTSFKPFNCNFDGKIVIDTIEYIAL